MILWFAAVGLSVAGLSQIYRSQLWTLYYDALMARGATAIRGHGAVVGFIGALVVVFHNVWSGPVLLLTAFGWLLLAEGVFCMVAPQISLRSMATAPPALRQKTIVATGVVVMVIAGVLWAVLLGPFLA